MITATCFSFSDEKIMRRKDFKSRLVELCLYLLLWCVCIKNNFSLASKRLRETDTEWLETIIHDAHCTHAPHAHQTQGDIENHWVASHVTRQSQWLVKEQIHTQKKHYVLAIIFQKLHTVNVASTAEQKNALGQSDYCISDHHQPKTNISSSRTLWNT